ncbi:MAG: Gfo/Idh/MocA family protein [Planctomycetota bacterium]|jgi:predicted dehydrogenase
MKRRDHVRRRDFLATTSAALGAPLVIPSGALAAAGKPGANDRMTVASIGVGGMGRGHLGRLLKFQDLGAARVAAVCDVDEKRLAEAAKMAGLGAAPYRDYRYVVLREDIDAVVIATPDHWHAVQTVHACETGKHVYVEKPASVTVREGQAMVEAARKNNCAVQVGAQGRSGTPAYYTCRAIRNGIIGKVNKVTCWHYETPYDQNPLPDGTPPPELDWDFWLGPMRWRPYNARYCHGTFRWMLDSGGGQIRDRGAHQFSAIMWCLGADEQVSYTVEATGTPPPMGAWDCPPTMDVVYTFKDPDWTLVWSQPGEKLGKTEFGQVFWGETGNLLLEWEGARKWAEPEAIEFKVPPGGFEPYHPDYFDDFGMNHMAEWLHAAKESRRPNTDIEPSHRVATLCNLGNLSYVLGRKLVWDGVTQEIVDDEAANRMLAMPQRHPYHL